MAQLQIHQSTMPTYMTHFKVTTRTVRFQGAWKDPSELMPDLYLRESQILVLKAQIEVLDQIRRGAVNYSDPGGPGVRQHATARLGHGRDPH